MLKSVQSLIACLMLLTIALVVIEARPPNSADENIQELNNIDNDGEDLRGSYYDLPSQSMYSSIPMDRLQFLLAQYRPAAYMRTPPSWNSGLNDLFRVPESKRQVRYRQCYFNPISCFRK